MRKLLAIFLGATFVAGPLAAGGQRVVEGEGYQVSLPPGWTRTESVPRGLDVGFRKKVAEGEYATFFFRHVVVAPEMAKRPADTPAPKRQWDTLIRNRYPDARPVVGSIPKVHGWVFINAEYELTDDGQKVRRRYTYFFAGRTAFIVQCTAVPGQWARVLADFDTMVGSLKPGGKPGEKEAKSDDAAEAELRRDIPVLLRSLPPRLRCSLSEVKIAPSSSKDKRTLVIALSFGRGDIEKIYRGTRWMFKMMREGKTQQEDLQQIPEDLRTVDARDASQLMAIVGQVWGAAWSNVADVSPAIGRYTLPILDANGKRVGSISISSEDAAALLGGKIRATDTKRLGSIYVFE